MFRIGQNLFSVVRRGPTGYVPPQGEAPASGHTRTLLGGRLSGHARAAGEGFAQPCFVFRAKSSVLDKSPELTILLPEGGFGVPPEGGGADSTTQVNHL